MAEYRYTDYFENEVLRKRPYLKKEWCIRVIENADRIERQEHNRYRFWARIAELGDRTIYIMLFQIEATSHEAQILQRHGFALHRSVGES